MLVFVDESGDTGMSGKEGQSDYFVVTLIRFESNEQAERADERIDRLRSDLQLNKRFEFHFYGVRSDTRRKFLQTMVSYDWGFLAFVMNKRALCSSTFNSPDKLHNYTTSLVFENAKPYLADATVVIDAKGVKLFRRELSKYLKRQINREEGLIRKIKHEESHRNNLLQLTDMVSGSIYRSMNPKKKDDWDYRKIVERKAIEPVQVWP